MIPPVLRKFLASGWIILPKVHLRMVKLFHAGSEALHSYSTQQLRWFDPAQKDNTLCHIRS